MLISVREASELGSLVGKPGETLAETLRRTLLEMIVAGYFKPGARLLAEKLAAQFGVSLTPVREALMRLASEGFIEAVQRRGYHVRVPDAQQVRNLWQVRLALELMAGELVVRRLQSGELREDVVNGLDEIQDEIDVDPETVPQRRKHELNSRLHHRLVELSGNSLLASTYQGIQLQVMTAWFQRGRQTWRKRRISEAEEHRAIIAALRSKDASAFAHAMRRHLDRSLNDALNDVAVQTDPPDAHAEIAKSIN